MDMEMTTDKMFLRLISVVSLSLLAPALLAAVPAPAFSFKYDGKPVKGGASLQVDARLKVTVERTEYPDSDATEWVLWFENPSAENSGILSEILDGDFLVPLPTRPRPFPGNCGVPGDRAVVTMKGCVSGRDYSTNDRVSALEFRPMPHYFHPWNPSSVSRANGDGRPSEGEAPFFEITQAGEGAVVALGWTGDWKATFANDEAQGVRVQTGLRNARFYLKPGEKLRTARVLVMNYGKGEDAGNKFRRLIRNHFSHVATQPGSREGLFANELWGGLTSDEMVRRLGVLKAKGIRFEDEWIDAGWYGNSKKCDDAYTGDWGAWTGDWTENLRIHPDRFEKVRDAAKELGAGLMLWFEPERVVKSSNFAKTHPELLLKKGHPHSDMLDYGNPAARKHVADLITDYAHRLNFSCYRQDFNMGVSKFYEVNDEKDRRGVTEIRQVMGLYQVWDEIRARNPGMLIDNCASGGRRLDLEALRRTVFFFRSDYQCAFNANADVVQAHNANLSRLIPYSGCTTKLSDLYALRSAYSSSYGVAYWNAIFQDEAKVDWAAAKKVCDEYLRIRKYFSRDFHNHGSTSADPSAWALWQYHNPETKAGVVLAFRRAESPCDRVQVPLKGLPAGAQVIAENLDTGAKSDVKGDLEIMLKDRRSSAVIAYKVR